MISVDRIESGIVTVTDENGRVTDIPRNKISGDVREGDILVGDGENLRADKALTEKRRTEIRKLESSLWE